MDVAGHFRPQQAGEREVVVVPEVVRVVVKGHWTWDSEHLEPQVEPIGQQTVREELFGSIMQL